MDRTIQFFVIGAFSCMVLFGCEQAKKSGEEVGQEAAKELQAPIEKAHEAAQAIEQSAAATQQAMEAQEAAADAVQAAKGAE